MKDHKQERKKETNRKEARDEENDLPGTSSEIVERMRKEILPRAHC
jgi:hypothetical protein